MTTEEPPSSSPPPPIISIPLPTLQSNTVPLQTLVDAFGPDSLGIIIVTSLPPEYAQLRRRLLSLASYLASLPAHQLQGLEVPEANFAVGWSHGKERLKEGRYDFSKGSFYAAPVHDEVLEAKARTLYGGGFPEFTTPNVWPAEDVLPEFREVFEGLCGVVVGVAGEVARAVDRFGGERVVGYPEGELRGEGGMGFLEGMVRGSVGTKGRLLHYFPPAPTPEVNGNGNGKEGEGEGEGKDDDDDDDDDWCATHRDLGALTGLTSNMYIDETLHPPNPVPSSSSSPSMSFPDLPELPTHPDPKAGLWIHSRAGHKVQVQIPRDALAFQTGEVLEMLTKGELRAVPHFVRGGKGRGSAGVARNTLAVFTQPNLWDVVDLEGGRDFAEIGGRNLRGFT